MKNARMPCYTMFCQCQLSLESLNPFLMGSRSCLLKLKRDAGRLWPGDEFSTLAISLNTGCVAAVNMKESMGVC